MQTPHIVQGTPPPSPDIWDMPSTPPRDPSDLSGCYPLPRTPTPERFPRLDFSQLLDSPTTGSGSLDPFGDKFTGKGKNPEIASTAWVKYTSPNASFGQGREVRSKEMKDRNPAVFVPGKTKYKVLQMSGNKVIVDPEPPRVFQVISETQYRELDEGSRKGFQIAYKNSEGIFYASNDAAEPVERVIRARREEWRYHIQNRRQI